MENQEQKLKDICFSWTWNVDHVLRDKLNRRLYGTPTFQDQMRLLSLRTWSIKYKLDLDQILEILVPIWSKKFEKFSKRATRTGKDEVKGLGVKIATLCGDKSESIIAAELKKQYPDDEHIRVWKSREQEKQLRRNEEIGEFKLTAQTLKGFIEKYRRRVRRERKEYQKVITSGKFTKRKYPGSPWAA